jgi:hypothetical protein
VTWYQPSLCRSNAPPERLAELPCLAAGAVRANGVGPLPTSPPNTRGLPETPSHDLAAMCHQSLAGR